MSPLFPPRIIHPNAITTGISTFFERNLKTTGRQLNPFNNKNMSFFKCFMFVSPSVHVPFPVTITVLRSIHPWKKEQVLNGGLIVFLSKLLANGFATGIANFKLMLFLFLIVPIPVISWWWWWWQWLWSWFVCRMASMFRLFANMKAKHRSPDTNLCLFVLKLIQSPGREQTRTRTTWWKNPTNTCKWFQNSIFSIKRCGNTRIKMNTPHITGNKKTLLYMRQSILDAK